MVAKPYLPDRLLVGPVTDTQSVIGFVTFSDGEYVVIGKNSTGMIYPKPHCSM